MSEVKVSELPEASSVNDEDLVMIVQNNINKKATRDKVGNIAVSSTKPTTGEKVWFKTGKNLFDKNNGIVNGSFLTSNGGIGSDANLFYQEKYIPVNPNTSYTMSATTGEPYRIAQYNSNKGFISRLLNDNSNKNYTFTTDANCHYIRISSTISNLDSIQVEYGNTATTHENYIEKDIYILNENKVYVPYMKEITDNDTGDIVLDDGLNIRYRKVGKLVTLNINYRGDQAQTSKQLTAYGITELATLPTGYRPSVEIDAPLFVRLDNGATTDCYLIIYTNGKIDVFNWGTAKIAVGIIGNVSFFVS